MNAILLGLGAYYPRSSNVTPSASLTGHTINATFGACAEVGSQITATATSGTPIGYQWATSENGDIAGATQSTYDVDGAYDLQNLFCKVQFAAEVVNTNALLVRFAPPNFVVLPSLSPVSAIVCDPIAIALGNAAPGNVTLSITQFDLDGVDKIPEISNLSWDSTGAPTGTLNLAVSATNSGGSIISAPVSISLGTIGGTVVEFGALTAAGEGGIALPNGANAIGNAGGTNLIVSAGMVVPGSAAGVTSGTVTFDNGIVWTINALAAQRTVADVGQFNAAVSAAGSDETIILRAAMAGVTLNLSNVTKTNLSITGEAGHTIRRIDANNCAGVRFDAVNIEHDNAAGADWGSSNDAAVYVSGGELSVENSAINCGPSEDGSKRTPAQLRKRFGGFKGTAGATLNVHNCTILRVRDGVVVNNGVANITHCHFEQCHEDGITGVSTHWTVDDNTATLFEATAARSYSGTLTGSLAPGDLLLNGAGRQAMEVISVTSNSLQARINNYDLPTNGAHNRDASNYFTISSDNGELPGQNIHGDFFQPVLQSGSANYQVYARRNAVYRKTPYVLNAIAQEHNVQGILAQRNGGTGYHAPCKITHNVIAAGQPIGIKANFCGSATDVGDEISFNTVLWPQYGIRSDLELQNCRNLDVNFNCGDNNSGGAVDDRGGHTNVTFGANNVFVDGNSGAELANYASPQTFPASLASFAPIAGSAVDLGNAGALTTSATFRQQVGPLLSAASGSQTGQTTAALSVNTDFAGGTLYAAVFQSAITPTVDEVKTGAGAIWQASVNSPGVGAEAFSAIGLTSATNYRAHFVHNDGVDDSTIATSQIFTTASQFQAPSVVETNIATESGAGVTFQSSDFTAALGAGRMVVSVASFFNGAQGVTDDLSATWGGVSPSVVVSQGSNGGNSYEGVSIFVWKEADFPVGETGPVVITPNAGSHVHIAVATFTVRDANQSQSLVVANDGTTSGPASAIITPTGANNLIIGGLVNSIASTALGFTSLPKIASAVYSSQSQAVGATTHGASSLTVTSTRSGDREGLVLMAFSPI